VVLGISLIALRIFAHPLDLNSLSENELARILRLNGVKEPSIRSLLAWRKREGWIWTYEDLLLCGIPEEMLPWFRYHFSLSWTQDIPLEDIPPDLADFLIYPLDLNRATPSALMLLPGMTDERVRTLLAYRRDRGLTSVRDLLRLGWTPEEIRLIAPYITLSPPTNTFRWHHAIRMEPTGTLYRTTLSLANTEGYLLLPSPEKTTGNLSSLSTQSVIGVLFTPGNLTLAIGDFRYQQANGVLFGRPFVILSRHPSDMIVWEHGISRPYTAQKDQDHNGEEEVLRGIATAWKSDGFSIGALWGVSSLRVQGGYVTIGHALPQIGFQLFSLSNRTTNTLMGSVFGRIPLLAGEVGGEYALSQGTAWIAWMKRTKPPRLALALYQGETNFFVPLGGALYRGIRGKTGILGSMVFSLWPWECQIRGEWYTNTFTTYTTTKTGLQLSWIETLSTRFLSLSRIDLPLSLDNRTNELFLSSGITLSGRLFSPVQWETRFLATTHDNEWGSQSHIRLSLKTGAWQTSLWYGYLVPISGNPFSLTFPPLETQEMESLWLYHQTNLWCFVLRYHHQDISLNTRLIIMEKQTRLAVSLQWVW